MRNGSKSNIRQSIGKILRYIFYGLCILTVWLALNGRINQRKVFNYCANAWEYVTSYIGNTMYKLVNPKTSNNKGLDFTKRGVYIHGKEKNLDKSTEEHIKDANKEADNKDKSKDDKPKDKNDKDNKKENKK